MVSIHLLFLILFVVIMLISMLYGDAALAVVAVLGWYYAFSQIANKLWEE